jgi:hypothetical protein
VANGNGRGLNKRYSRGLALTAFGDKHTRK